MVISGAALAGGFRVRRWWTRPLEGRRPEATVAQERQITPLDVAEVVYDGKPAPGWEDRGWGPHQQTDGGVKVQFAGYGGIILRHERLPSRFGAVVFRFLAPSGFDNFLTVSLRASPATAAEMPVVAVEPRHVARLSEGNWREALIPMRELNPLRVTFDQIIIKANRQVGPDWVSLDKIVLTAPSADEDAGPPPVRKVSLSIDCRAPAIPINPLIYGIAQGELTAGESGHRVGGNAMTRHNWDLGAWNSGSDWFFENTKGTSTIWDWVEDASRDNLKLAITVPIIGWVAKDGTSVGFPVSRFGAQKEHDPDRPEAGDGTRPDGKLVTPAPPTWSSVAAPPEMIRGWIERMRKLDSARPHKSVAMYILDNEPNLWNRTHRDVHPDPLSYDELLDRTLRYGAAIRQADPDAVIAGPAEWGWPGYFFSAKDQTGFVSGLDRKAHGEVPLLPWYLGRLANEEKRTGVHILDVVDVHFYPQGKGVFGKDARTDPETAALRLRSTRSLWDPTYADESWIKERIGLIPRLKDWIAKNYPGRGISLGEWNFGADDHMSGGLAIAETLGRFGQQGLTSAFYWSKVPYNSPGFYAFRAYRNFDGKGARFLDLSVPARGADQVSLFASRDESGTHLVAIALNLDPAVAAEAELDVSSCGHPSGSRTFVYGPGRSSITLENSHHADQTLLHEVIPPYSLKIIELTLPPHS